ncbi:sensor histidine kinase [Microlunatus sp. Y2014]|uniref:sensor histidine kinase n=1 Tax=Microlunatus sp. Y2014 TaxID=3418488 RepID=UPI003DA79C65
MTRSSMHRSGFLLLVIGSAVLLLPMTIIIAVTSLPIGGGVVVSLAATAAHAALLALRRAPTTALLLITAAIAAQAVVTGLFVLFPSGLLLLVGLHAAASRGDRRVALAVAAIGPIVAAIRYAVDPAVVRSPFGPEPWLLAVLLLAVSAVAIVLGFLRRSELRAARSDDVRRELEEQGRIHREEAVAAAERARMSRDLHDVLAHSLTVIVGQARVARFAPGQAIAALDVIEETARESLNDLRAALRTLRDGGPGSDPGPPPGLTDLDALAARMEDLGLRIRRRTVGTARVLDPATELVLHRFVQEGLTNALRHGDGMLDWEQRWGEDRLVVILHNTVASPARETVGGGLGLRGMRERLDTVGGSLTVDRSNGFTVTASVPLLPVVAEGPTSTAEAT